MRKNMVDWSDNGLVIQNNFRFRSRTAVFTDWRSGVIRLTPQKIRMKAADPLKRDQESPSLSVDEALHGLCPLLRPLETTRVPGAPSHASGDRSVCPRAAR